MTPVVEMGYNFNMGICFRECIGTDAAAVRARLPGRAADTGKSDYGNLLIVAGWAGMTGAAALASKAALRSGAGLVRLAIPKNCRQAVQVLVPEAICTEPAEALGSLERYDAAAVGPGMGVNEETRSAVATLLTTYGGPLVLDADALNSVARYRELEPALRDRRGFAETVITPHMGEALRLMPETRGLSRLETAQALTENYGAVTVLKGSGTLICSPQGELRENGTGNPGMATAGSGDVLTGVLAALLGQKLAAFDAAFCAVFLHGRAGDIACSRYGEYGLIAGDICRSLPQAFMSLAADGEA